MKVGPSLWRHTYARSSGSRPVPAMRPDFEEELCERIDLEARLAALPDHLQVCLRLRLTGLNSREIADQLGVSRGCVLYRLSQALKSLGVESTNFFSDF